MLDFLLWFAAAYCFSYSFYVVQLKHYQAPVTLDDGSEQVQDITEATNLLSK